MRPLIVALVVLGVVGVGAGLASSGAKAPELPPAAKKGFTLGPACNELTVHDAATAVSWAFDEGRSSKTQAAAFARVFEGCSQTALLPLMKSPATAAFMYSLGHATYKGLVAGGIVTKAAAQGQLDGWRQLALSGGVAAQLLPDIDDQVAARLELPPPEKKGYGLGENCGQLTVYDPETAVAWAYDQGFAAKTQAEAFARVFEGCHEAFILTLLKSPPNTSFMYMLGRATWKGLVAGGALDQATAQGRLDSWRSLALTANVAVQLLPGDV